jgi:transposase
MTEKSTIDVARFYPEDLLSVVHVEDKESGIIVKLKSKADSCACPKCNEVSRHFHGTYVRKAKDLPILGKGVRLEITSRDYRCDNEECDVVTIAETYRGFLNTHSRMTDRLEDFLCTLALETSCEGASRICKMIGINVSGDTIIRILVKRFENEPPPEHGPVIGIDDFAFKKRHKYGTMIVDGESRRPVAILDGRDGGALRQWLKNNKKARVVTRDRASAYAKAISEELPDAMQVADRFHLHQNLLAAVKGALNHAMPATVMVPHEGTTGPSPEPEEQGKKNATRR